MDFPCKKRWKEMKQEKIKMNKDVDMNLKIV